MVRKYKTNKLPRYDLPSMKAHTPLPFDGQSLGSIWPHCCMSLYKKYFFRDKYIFKGKSIQI